MAKILIIDDAKFTRTVLKKIITEFGHETIEAENGKEGLDKICSEEPDVVLTDVLMPEMDGTELLKILRETGIEVPIIIVSSNIQYEVITLFKKMGITFFFSKPPDKEALKKAIEIILNK